MEARAECALGEYRRISAGGARPCSGRALVISAPAVVPCGWRVQPTRVGNVRGVATARPALEAFEVGAAIEDGMNGENRVHGHHVRGIGGGSVGAVGPDAEIAGGRHGRRGVGGGRSPCSTYDVGPAAHAIRGLFPLVGQIEPLGQASGGEDGGVPIANGDRGGNRARRGCSSTWLRGGPEERTTCNRRCHHGALKGAGG